MEYAGVGLRALIVAGLFIFGGGLALIRDQDGPWMHKPDGASGNPYKEIGVGLIGLPFLPLCALYLGPSWEAVWIGAGAWALTSAAWSLQHAVTSYVTGRPEHALEADNAEALINLALGGMLVTLGPAIALAWFGHPFLAILCLAFGAMKAVTYKVGWMIRPIPGRKPEATFLGHVGHGALALGGSALCLVLA
jgi:hypothetical protein